MGAVTGSSASLSARAERDPARWLLAARQASRDLTNTNEAAIVEIASSRSRIGRRFAGWDLVAGELSGDPETAAALRERHRLGPIDLDALEAPRAPMEALVKGHQMRSAARALFGRRWDEMWARPIADVRRELGVGPGQALGEGVRAAA